MIVNSEEFKSRRTKVLQHLKDLEENQGLKNPKAIIFSGKEKKFSNDVHYPFRVNSDFYYLTGFTEAESAIVLDPNSQNPYTLYVRPKDPAKEIWDGYRAGLEGAKEKFQADHSADIASLNDATKANATDVSAFIHSLRSIKSAAEVETMRKAAKISIQAHRVLRESITPGIHEYELEAILLNVFRANGANGWAYPPIVASGQNSCVLHYTENNAIINKDSLILVDAGCEFEFYASDITRVYPSNFQFTQKQQDIYDIVLAAQEKAIETIKPGASFADTHKAASEVIVDGLYDLKYIKDKNNEAELKKYYMHGTGHSIGLDVHDLGVDRQIHKYVPGMVTTVEPGIYIAEEGIGIRIEDDILVTNDSYENLTLGLEK